MIEDIGSTLLAFSCRIEIVNMRVVYAVSDKGGEQERALVKNIWAGGKSVEVNL